MLSSAQVHSGLVWSIGACLYGLAAAPALREGSMPGVTMAASLALGLALVTASTIDLHTFILPDAITMPLIVSGLGAHLLQGGAGFLLSAVAAASGYGLLWTANWLYLTIRGRQGVGMGDAKLLAGAGAWLDAQLLPTVLLWATAFALASALAAAGVGRQLELGTRLPFGPSLAAGFWLTWLYGAIG